MLYDAVRYPMHISYIIRMFTVKIYTKIQAYFCLNLENLAKFWSETWNLDLDQDLDLDLDSVQV